jgi:histone-lysine N-methyltransferase SETMAR
MVTVFRDLEGILLIEYMKRGSTITGEVYKETIRKLKAAIQQKSPHNCDQKIVLLYENCRVHKTRQVVEVEHSPYSPDLAPSDYYLPPRLKKHLKECRFSSDEYLKEAVEKFIEDLSKDFLKT